jgi:hypothetical protein
MLPVRYYAGMPSSPARPARTRRPKPDRHRVLELLAGAGPAGCTEALLLATGVTIETLVELVRAELATATPQRVKAGRDRMEVATLRITDAGWQVLAAEAARR